MGQVTGITDVGGYHYPTFSVAGTETAGTATVSGHWVAPAACTLYEIIAVPGAAITGADTDTRHLNAEAPASTEIGNVDYVDSTDAAADTAISLYSSSTGVALTAGQMVIVRSALIGNGQAMPGGFSVRLKVGWN